MLSQLGYDPANMHKRLGDGFYEQKLVRDQIGQLTGRRFLEGYASDEAQYRALLEAGSTFAKAWNLRPGVALSAEQMAQLTSDIVWLVERDVTLADGTTTRALVPQVYVRVKPGDIDGRGTMLAANAIDLNLKGDLVNSGTIAGRTAVKLTSENLRNLGGRITGDAVALTARTDIDNIGGTLDASSTLLVNAGRDLNVATTTHSDAKQAGRSDFSRTNIDRVAGLYVTSPGGILLASAGRDANLIAAQIINSGRDGQTAIIAGRDLTLGTVKIAEQENNVRNASNYLKQGYVQDVGTNITTAGDVRLQAGRDLTAIAATVTSEHGALVAVAQGDVNILAGEASRNWSEGRQHKSRSLLGSSKKTSRDSLEETKAVSSTFSGNTVAVQGQNVTVTGSNVVSDAGTVIVARNDLTIQAATETSSESHFREAKKSGVFSGGGVGFTVGKQMQSDDQKVIRTTAASSTVGSISGDVNLAAGNQYRQIGSDILAPEGDISVVAKNIEISEARQSSQAEQESKFKQSGLTVSLSSPIINAVETTSKVVNATRETDSGRMKALGSAMAGLNAYDAYAAGSDIAKAVKNGEDPRKAASVGINISAGSSKSESRTTQTTETAHGSTVKAGGSVSLVATGAGQDSNILIRGSEITAGKNATLMADNRVDLVAAENHEQMQGKRSSSSASVGVGINFGGDQNGITLNASGSKGRGKSNGKDNWYTNSRLNARDTVLISSGSDTNIRGAGVAGNTVKLDVGGDLNIESLQNTNTYTSKDKTTGAGISVCIPPLCAGTPVSANINIQKAKATGNYASVEEQSGIQAGDGGFDIRVKGNTDLKGALIASNQAAIDAGKNRLETASLTTSDIQNRAKASAKSSGISLSSDYLSQGKYGIGKTLIGNAMDSGSAADSSTGITKTAVSNATVIITDESKQKELTGTDAETTVAALNRDTVNAHVAAQKIDIKELEQQARAEQVIKTAVTAQAFKFSDDAYRTMFLDEHPIYRVELNAEGKVVFDEFGHAVVHKLSPEEKANMQAGSGGQVRVGVNGIFNDADAAAYYADQHNGGVVQPLYIVHFPQADSMVGELMVAGYQKFLENNFWGLSNSTQEVQNLMRQYGISGLLLDAHSRGSMTVGNAMGSLINDGDSGILANTDINFYGPAFSAQRAADLLYQLSGGTKDLVNLQNHKDDFVGSILGGNPATHSLRPDSSNKVKEWIRMFSSPNTVHSCYGFAGRECTDRYNDARTIEIRTRIER
ncbi:TPA: hemagglutinin repeat-containing protein [Pseudomonas aeruginosa]|nr:hemagglutinin repeat-containing protein [Pseudomonas aeruginosa]